VIFFALQAGLLLVEAGANFDHRNRTFDRHGRISTVAVTHRTVAVKFPPFGCDNAP
jgi:hypothetical protein